MNKTERELLEKHGIPEKIETGSGEIFTFEDVCPLTEIRSVDRNQSLWILGFHFKKVRAISRI